MPGMMKWGAVSGVRWCPGWKTVFGVYCGGLVVALQHGNEYQQYLQINLLYLSIQTHIEGYLLIQADSYAYLPLSKCRLNKIVMGLLMAKGYLLIHTDTYGYIQIQSDTYL